MKKSTFGEAQHLPRMKRSTAPQRTLAGKPQSQVPFKFSKSIIPDASMPAPCVVTQNNPIALHYLYLGTGCHGLKNISPSFPVHQPQPWLGEKTPFRLASLALLSCSLSPVPSKVSMPEPPCIPFIRPSPSSAPSPRQRSPRPVGNHFKDLPSHKN